MVQGRGGARPGSGPKPRPPEKHRRNRIMLNLDDEEHAQLMKAAQGESPAAFARSIVLRYLTRRRS